MAVEDMLESYFKAQKNLIVATDSERAVKYTNTPKKGKVGIVTGGGIGHKPAFIVNCGSNMVVAVAVGEIYSSPPVQ